MMIAQEVLNYFNMSVNNTYNSLNESIKNIIGTFDKSDLISYLMIFIQQNLIGNKLTEFLLNEEISIVLKLIFLFKHSSQEDLIINLDYLLNFYISKGYLEGLILTGNSQKSITLLQNYLNATDDLLVSVILSKFFIDPKENFYSRCETELFDTLNRMKMFNERLHLNQKLNEIVLHMEKGYKVSDNKGLLPTSAEFILNCFYCNAKISSDRAEQLRNTSANYKEGDMVSKQQ
jgi:hypothetical protein